LLNWSLVTLLKDLTVGINDIPVMEGVTAPAMLLSVVGEEA